jgi:putative hemolysin
VFSQIFRKSHKFNAKKYLNNHPYLYFYNKLYDLFFPHKYAGGIFTSSVYAKNIARFGYGISSFLVLFPLKTLTMSWGGIALVFILLFFLYLFLGDLLPRLLSLSSAQKVFLYGAPFASIYQTLLFPITLPYLKIIHHFQDKVTETPEHILNVREKVYELIQESLPGKTLEQADKELIESILKFKERIVREVMVPRADIFALPQNTKLKDIAKELFEENYSRIPIYKDSLDNVIGVLFYKDFLSLFMTASLNHDSQLLEQTVDQFMKEPLYTPETTKISHLLQEFLQKQQHLALVVDEFGAVEGVVTIEDLLEEIVGEIEDEYDEDENQNHILQQRDAWIVSGKLTLHEIEETTNLKIPHHGGYDTIGGFVIHRAGRIPPIGLKISQDDFDLEVISASERNIHKVKITPRHIIEKL